MHVPEFSPVLHKEELFSVIETLEDNWVTEGKKTKALEAALAAYTGAKHVIMMPNGTLAIFAALKVLGIGPGDEVIVPDFTFFGTASAVILTGAKPVLVDVDEYDFNISVASAEMAITGRTRAIVPVHMYGQSCDMQAVRTLARRHGLFVVEDAAQGMGVTFGGHHVGTLGDIGCVSFFADKTMTTGEGGALFVNDDRLAEACIYFKNQGRRHRGSFVHEHVGYNFRITDLQAAIGVAQFDRLGDTISRKLALRDAYYTRLAECPGVGFARDNGFGDVVPFRVNILVDDPEGLAAHLKQRSIDTRRFFYPLHLQPSLSGDNCVVPHKPISSVRLFEKGLMLPSGLNLRDQEIEYVCAAIQAFQRERYEVRTGLAGRVLPM